MKINYLFYFFTYLMIAVTGCAMTEEQPDLRPKTQAPQTASISGIIHNVAEGDTVSLMVWEFYSSDHRYNRFFEPEVYYSTIKGGKFKFVFPVTAKAQYFSLKSPGSSQFNQVDQFVEPGDSLFIEIEDDDITYSGTGAAKLQCLKEIKYQLEDDPDAPQKEKNYIASTRESVQPYLDYQRAALDYKVDLLKRYKEKLNSTAYNIILADIVGRGYYSIYRMGTQYFSIKDTLERAGLLDLYKETLYGQPTLLTDKIPQEYLALSGHFAEYILKKFKADPSYRFWNSSPTFEDTIARKKETAVFDNIMNEYEGQLRDKLLFLYIHGVFTNSPQEKIDYCLTEALGVIQTPYYRDILEVWRQNFSKGAVVLDFEYQDTEGNKVRLSDFKGKMVFVDIWFTGCGACQYVADGMEVVEKAFEDRDDIVFLSISIDKDKDKWLQSIRKDGKPNEQYRFAGQHYSGKRSIYLYTGGKGENDPFIERYVTLGYPTLLLIDKDGKLYSFNPPRPWRTQTRYDHVIKYLRNALKKS